MLRDKEPTKLKVSPHVHPQSVTISSPAVTSFFIGIILPKVSRVTKPSVRGKRELD